MGLAHREDGGDNVGNFSGQQFVHGVVDRLDTVVVGKFLAAVAGAVHQRDDFAVRMLGVGAQVVAAPGPGTARYGNSVFPGWQIAAPFHFATQVSPVDPGLPSN